MKSDVLVTGNLEAAALLAAKGFSARIMFLLKTII